MASVVSPLSPSAVEAQAAWQGFAVSQLPSLVAAGNATSWGLGITEDLGGAGIDVWNNNHGLESEAIVDLGTPGQALHLAEGTYGAPNVSGPDSHGITFFDMDGDGDEDLLEVNGRNNDNRLFRNDNGVLVHVDAGGLKDFNGRGRQGLAYDADGDGDMDILVPNLDRVPIDGLAAPSELYLNNGSGTGWAKVADPSSVISNGNLRIAQQTSTGPATPQIVVTHASFALAIDSIATRTSGLEEPSNGATRRNYPSGTGFVREVLVGDFDGDLHPELIALRGSAATSAGNWPIDAFDLIGGTGGRSVTLPVGSLVDNCRSGAAADFDNDGDLDIFAGCAQRQEGQTRNILLLNDGQGVFSIAGAGLLPATIAETPAAIVVADSNGDGWMDAIAANGYDFENAIDHVFTNGGGSNHWLQIDLVGSNPDAAGAQVFVGTDDGWQVRETGHRNHRSQDSKTLHFGLGGRSAVADVEIMWPDGIFQTCTVAGTDRRVTITKGSPSCSAQTKAGLLAALATDPVTGPPPAPPEFCQGRVVTVSISKGQSPTNGSDVILGTSGADSINALAGDDFVCGLGGNDSIDGGPGNDRIQADDGDDSVEGGDGRDVIRGGAGVDTINGGRNNDRVSGNGGSDIIRGGNGRDVLNGNAGRDTIIGGGGNDRIDGGGGRDTVDGSIGFDFCNRSEVVRKCEA
ncbi:MAG: CRTAC homolog protein [Acidimicrobiales bacterium]